MQMNRRVFFRNSAVGAAVAAAGSANAGAQDETAATPFADLKNMTAQVERLTPADFDARIEKARRLMAENRMEVLLVTGGTSMEYFGGVRWGVSERLFALLLPVRGQVTYVCPKFEEGRAREQVRNGHEIRAWEEDQDPYELVRGILQDRGIATGTVALEPSVREFVADGLRKACTSARFVNGDAISRGCRIIKSPKELSYIALACEITKRAYSAALRTVRNGMPQSELARGIAAAHSRLGAPGGAAVSFGPAAAYPHGSMADHPLRAGDVILMDGGCRVQGFQSDITRTVVFGKPSDKIRKVWDIVKQAQDAAFTAVRDGAPCESVDAAARKVIIDAGYGPGYRYFTHRVGHGVGMDGHEDPYLVKGNRMPLRRGMTFSDEPGIYIPEEFGIRLEDLVYVGEDQGHFFGNTSSVLETYG
jgi:Xaa-Pro dipeptidase